MTLPQSTDAREWAKAFLFEVLDSQDPADLEIVTTWFANAIMAGYDLGVRTTTVARLRDEDESRR